MSDDEAPEEFSFSTGKKSTLEQGEKEQKAKKDYEISKKRSEENELSFSKKLQKNTKKKLEQEGKIPKKKKKSSESTTLRANTICTQHKSKFGIKNSEYKRKTGQDNCQ